MVLLPEIIEVQDAVVIAKRLFTSMALPHLIGDHQLNVTSYMESHEVADLIGIYERLRAEYPQSPWLIRADPYRLLKK